MAQTLLSAQASPAVGASRSQFTATTRLPSNALPRLTLTKRSVKASRTARAALAVPAGSDLFDPLAREQLAKEYGFRQIGEPVPDDVTLKQVVDTIPPEAFEINDFKSWRMVLLTLASFGLGEFLIYNSPWYLLPLAWAWTGTAFTGFFVIGHDCAHKSFSRNKLIEDIVGTVMFMPLIYPYEPWRFKHDRHHAKTNMLVGDTAWHPMPRSEYESMGEGAKVAVQIGLGPFRFLASIGHWFIHHFDLKTFRANEQDRVKISLAAVFAFAAIGWPLIIAKFGIMGWVNLWLMPWLGFHFWMSTFTMVHHTAPHIPFRSVKEWNSAKAQLGGTVHCDYPAWIEILCHDINVHVPHHVASRIPSYNLRMANEALRKHWGKHMNEATWNWKLMRTIFTECHIYDEEKNYVPFDAQDEKESPVLGAMRAVMPGKN